MDVLITGESAKLPPAYADLIDPGKPIPTGVAYFEKKVVTSDLAKAAGLALALAVTGAMMIILGILVLSKPTVAKTSTMEYSPLFFGIILIFASWMMFSSLKKRREVMALQNEGTTTRLGIYLTSDCLFEVNEYGYCVIPREHFRGRECLTIKYVLGAAEKSFRLPAELTNADTSAMASAIDQWAATS